MSDLYHDYLTKKRIEAHNALIRQMKNHYPNNEGFKTLTEKTVINAVGNYPLNAWQHSYTIGKLYFSLGEFTSRTIGYVKECAAINHLSIATFEDTLKDLYNNARGIELAKQCANVEEFESRLFELEFTSNEDGTGIVPVDPPYLILDEENDYRVFFVFLEFYGLFTPVLNPFIRDLLKNIPNYRPIFEYENAKSIPMCLTPTAHAEELYPQFTPTYNKAIGAKGIPSDPIILDINGNGIKMSNNSSYFDFGSDGFAVSRLGFNPTSRNRDIEFKIEKAA